ncbi:hypothetical protein [uncultured Muribaculum sp.]|uniref:hypothetical protein n=1 Tax=uncultured Muribaculum sp. TaxID=1918613 RepID=UPI0025B7986A|nr:hypothetical protein [uncultured Muribaculum sp.]
MSISEIIVVRPAELNQELFDNVLGKDKAKNEEEYRNGVKEMIARELARNSEMLFRVDVEKAMMAKYGDMELPAEVLKKRLADICQVKIEEQDLINHAKMIARAQFAQYGMTNMDDDTLTDYARRILADKNYRPRIVEEVGDVKLFDALKDKITVDNKTVSLDEFKEIATKE